MKIVLVAAAIVVLVSTTAGGCGKAPADKFTRDCTARGGHVIVQHRHGTTSKVCLPPA